MVTPLNRTSWSLTLLCLLAIVIGTSPIREGFARDPGPAFAARAQPATEIFDFVQINISSAAGTAVTFPAGQQICLGLQIDPNPISGVLTPCFGQLPGQRLYGNNPSTPFLRSSTYGLAVASNDTGCAVTIPAVQRADFGESGWYAIFNVVADCPDAPPPATDVPAPTAIPTEIPATIPPTAVPTDIPAPPTSVPTDVPATTAPPTETPVPDADGYVLLELRFVPGPSGETPATLPGPVCARIAVDPPLAGAALDTHCQAASFSQRFYYPDFGTTFPLSAAYSAVVVSNDSGCSATPGTVRDVTGDLGSGLLLDVIIDCAAATATPTPTATAAPTVEPTPTGTPIPTGTTVPTATSVPTGTAISTETPTPTGTSAPTATSVSTGTAVSTATSVPSAMSVPPSPPPATRVPVTPSPTSNPGSSITPVPSPTPGFDTTPPRTSTAAAAIVGLPSTGSGGMGGSVGGTVMMAGILLVILAAGVLARVTRIRGNF